MITSARIKNFKCFADLELSDITPITLVGGQNNVGKSSLLEALFLSFDRHNPNMVLKQYRWRGLNSVPIEPETLWAPIFFGYDLKKQIAISIELDNHKQENICLKFNPEYIPTQIPTKWNEPADGSASIQTDTQPSPTFSLDIEYSVDSGPLQKSHIVTTSEGIGLQIEKMSSPPCPARFLAARVHTNPQVESNRYGKLDIVGKQDSVLEIMQIIEPRLVGLSSISFGETSVIHGDISLGRKIPIQFMGEGTARLLSIVLMLATVRDGILFIDEVENGFHHSIHASVWKAIATAARTYNTQIIATTHSYEFLKAAHEAMSDESAEDFRFIRLDRKGDNIVAKTFDHELFGASLASNMEVR